MKEIVANLHMHTTYSDGSGSHQDIIDAALATGLDVAMATDHNVLVQGVEGYYHSRSKGEAERSVLLLVGEEVHDQARDPQKSHLMVFGASREMATYASSPQSLIDQASRAGGLTFIAHPYDPELKAFREDDISWVDWDARGYTGLELWNGFSEFKARVRSKLDAIFYAYFPQFLARAPLPAALQKWDELLAKGQRVVAVGGSDAHAIKARMGPLRRTVFPYDFHFRAINTHLLLGQGLTGDLVADKAAVYEAFRLGHAFIGYDLPHPTRGFRFNAQGKDGNAIMGDEIRLNEGVTLQIRLPAKAECRLVCHGETVRVWQDREVCAQIVSKPGAYRVECYREYLGARRGWIFSNPIYVRA